MQYFFTFNQCFCSSAVPVTGKSSKDGGWTSFLGLPLFDTFPVDATEATDPGETDDVGMPQGKGLISPDSGVSLQVLSNNHLGPVFGVVLCVITGLVGLVGSGGGSGDF